MQLCAKGPLECVWLLVIISHKALCSFLWLLLIVAFVFQFSRLSGSCEFWKGLPPSDFKTCCSQFFFFFFFWKTSEPKLRILCKWKWTGCEWLDCLKQTSVRKVWPWAKELNFVIFFLKLWFSAVVWGVEAVDRGLDEWVDVFFLPSL